jgi:predicted ATPase
MNERLIVISGASGGGKSSLIAALALKGMATIAEPGRRIIAEQRACKGQALPWIDMAAFAVLAMKMARADRELAMQLNCNVFFDRGLIDAAAALQETTGEAALASVYHERYARCVFMAPPWPEIYCNDDDRPHDFAAADAEYHRLCQAYAMLGYRMVTLPRLPVNDRAQWVLDTIAASPEGA